MELQPAHRGAAGLHVNDELVRHRRNAGARPDDLVEPSRDIRPGRLLRMVSVGTEREQERWTVGRARALGPAAAFSVLVVVIVFVVVAMIGRLLRLFRAPGAVPMTSLLGG